MSHNRYSFYHDPLQLDKTHHIEELHRVLTDERYSGSQHPEFDYLSLRPARIASNSEEYTLRSKYNNVYYRGDGKNVLDSDRDIEVYWNLQDQEELEKYLYGRRDRDKQKYLKETHNPIAYRDVGNFIPFELVNGTSYRSEQDLAVRPWCETLPLPRTKLQKYATSVHGSTGRKPNPIHPLTNRRYGDVVSFRDLQRRQVNNMHKKENIK